MERPLPPALRPLRITDLESEVVDGTAVCAWGYTHATATVRAKGGGWLQLAGDTALAEFVAGGYSGAPLFIEPDRRRVVGMVVAAGGGGGRQMAFAVPVEYLQIARPSIG